MSQLTQDLPHTLGALRSSSFSEAKLVRRSVKDELRENLICRIQSGAQLFPGIIGYEDTVVPQVVNAVLSRHNFILLGLARAGQDAPHSPTHHPARRMDAVSRRAARSTTTRTAPICRRCRDLVEAEPSDAPIAWLHRDHRYVEKLATPDVTIADMIGDIDPIKAARRGQDISDELTVHYGLLPRANRGIFAINELPDLAGKIQVGLFNIMQEGDVQIKGYPVRLPLDLLLIFTANPEDYTARGKIITPLKDRIGSEIRTHYPAVLEQGIAITEQEAWVDRPSPIEVRVPDYIRRVVEQLAFLAREDKRVDKRSGVSQRLPISVLENVISNAERRALKCKDSAAVPRVTDIYSALPAITGKLELEYEGELKGGDTVARDLIRTAVGKIYNEYFEGVNFSQVVKWFDLGGSLKLDEAVDAATMVRQLDAIQGLMEKTQALGLSDNEPDAVRAAAAEFILEGLHAHRRISRNEERGFAGEEKPRPREPREREREEGKGERPNFRRGYN